MENRKDYEKRLGERLEAAYMQEDIGPVMSREEFHRLIQTAEKKKKHRRAMLSLAAACVALCLVCGGFVAGVTMRESASAGKDDETKTVQQGSSVVIGSGVSENDQNVGVSTKTYTNIEDIPEDIRKEIHFLDSDEFELEKVKVVDSDKAQYIVLFYVDDSGIPLEITEKKLKESSKHVAVLPDTKTTCIIEGYNIYIEETTSEKRYYFEDDEKFYYITMPLDANIKIETLIKGLME